MGKKVIGIDPGFSGGIAYINSAGIIDCCHMPDTPKDIFDKLKEIISEDSEGNRLEIKEDVVCYLEDVGGGRPGQAVGAMTKFARHNGHLEMALLALGVRIVKVVPQKWQKTLGIGSSSAYDKSEWKRRLKAKAQELYPDKKVTLVNADALLILNYALEKER